MPYFVYILTCADKSLYTGIAVDVKKRLKEHNGKEKGGAKYTSGRRPVKLSYSETLSSRSEAQVREYAIKQLSRKEKLALIKQKRMK